MFFLYSGMQEKVTQRVGWVENSTSPQAVWYQFEKIIYKQAACRSDSRIRHLFAEQGTHIALAYGQTSDSRIRPTRMMLPNCFYFVRLFLELVWRINAVWNFFQTAWLCFPHSKQNNAASLFLKMDAIRLPPPRGLLLSHGCFWRARWNRPRWCSWHWGTAP